MSKRIVPLGESRRFNGQLRPHHHKRPQELSSWEAWVGGPAAENRSSHKWLKILAILVGLLALGGIIVGLIVELS
jgi:hypothetical protein